MACWENYEAARTGLCFSCRKPMDAIVRIPFSNLRSAARTDICQNKDCVLFIDFSKVKNWQLAPELDFRPKTAGTTSFRF